MNNISGFQRMRRLQAEKAEAERKKQLDEALNEYANGSESGQTDPGEVKDQTDPENAVAGQNEPKNDTPKELTPEAIEAMDVDEVKAELEKREIRFAHNASEKKLREKLTDAIN